MLNSDTALAAARSGDQSAFATLITPYRRELRAHCYRMAGALHDADDLLQESLLRVWKGLSSFEGRSSLRTWLYKVTTSACLDALDRRSGRTLPMDLEPASDGSTPPGPPRLDPIWLEPCPEELYAHMEASPEARYSARESVAFAFLVALQLLPAKQRAVLILRDVLGWQASECAELLGLSIAAVNSALQRARETLEARAASARTAAADFDDDATTALLTRYVQAWEHADVSALVALLHEDATLSMPPISMWLKGPHAIGASISRMVLTPDMRGRFRLIPTRANGLPALAAYRLDPASGEFRALALHVLELSGGRVGSITAFLDGSLFPQFGLPSVLPN